MNILVFHHTDFDGYGAAAVVYASHLVKLDNYEEDLSSMFLSVNYNDRIVSFDRVHKLEQDYGFVPDMVYVVDLSLSTLDSLLQLQKIMEVYSCPAVYIDHHLSSVEAWDQYINYPELGYLKKSVEEDDRTKVILDILHSGAWLSYYNLIGDDIPDIITYIDDYDRWVHNYAESKLANTAFYASECLKDPTDSTWHDMFADYKCTELFVEKGRAIMSYIESNNKRYRDSYMYESTIKDENGNEYPVAVLSYKSNSDIFGSAYNEFPIVVSWAFDGEKYSYTLYSNLKDPKINCAAIAKMYGGGGHKGAAGFTSTELLFKGSTKLKGY